MRTDSERLPPRGQRRKDYRRGGCGSGCRALGVGNRGPSPLVTHRLRARSLKRYTHPPPPLLALRILERGTWEELDQTMSRAGEGIGDGGKPRGRYREAGAQRLLTSTETGRVGRGKTEKLVIFA